MHAHTPPADPVNLLYRLPIWRGRIDIEPLIGGMTNRNFVVTDGERRYVARVGGDIPIHGVMRFSEHAASRAAAAAGISPSVRYAEPGVLVLDFIEGRTFAPEDVVERRADCVALVKRAHREVQQHLRGPVLAFNVFHIVRDYGHTLVAGRSRMAGSVPRFLEASQKLAASAGPFDIVFGHNDLLANNFIDDGKRLWLIDWDYAGYNTPLFDLGGLSSNNGFMRDDEEALLEDYFERTIDDAMRRRFHAIQCASLLREAMWSMISEIHSFVDFDFTAYTEDNLARFDKAYAAFLADTR